MVRIRLNGNHCRAPKVLRWAYRGLRYKHTPETKPEKISVSQDDDTHDIDSEIKFPYNNPQKTVHYQDNLSNLSQKPLSINYQRLKSSGETVYLGRYKSVTSILNSTKPANEFFALRNWSRTQISEIGKEKFEEKMKTISKRGTLFHQNIQSYFTTKDHLQPDEGPNSGFWQSISHMLPDIGKVLAVESCVVHPVLEYAGTLDLIAEYKGVLSVIDWKTSQKRRPDLKDCFSYPQQIAAYAGAVNFDGNYPFQVFQGVIVIAYGDGHPADVHQIPQEIFGKYWEEWLARLHRYREKFPLPPLSASNREVPRPTQDPYTVSAMYPETNSLSAKSVYSIGTPIKKLGTVVKDDHVEEELTLQKDTKGLYAWLMGVKTHNSWKKYLKSFLQLLRSWRNTK